MSDLARCDDKRRQPAGGYERVVVEKTEILAARAAPRVDVVSETSRVFWRISAAGACDPDMRTHRQWNAVDYKNFGMDDGSSAENTLSMQARVRSRRLCTGMRIDQRPAAPSRTWGNPPDRSRCSTCRSQAGAGSDGPLPAWVSAGKASAPGEWPFARAVCSWRMHFDCTNRPPGGGVVSG